MSTDAEELAEAENVPLQRAETALKKQDGNYDQAQTALREAPVAIKSRFASTQDDIYGLFLLKVNNHPPNLKKMNVLVGNDKGIGNVKLSLSPNEFDSTIDRLAQEKGKMTALTQQLIESLQKKFSPPSGKWIELIRNREELELQQQLSDYLSDQLDQEQIMMTLTLEAGLVEQEETALDETSDFEHQKREIEQTVELLCDLRVSPVRGEPVKNISAGDTIFVTIKEGQDEHKRLIDVIDGLKNEKIDMIPVPVENISRTRTGKLEFIVQFGENVRGKVVAGEDMNILTPDSVADAEGIRSSDSLLPWVLLFCILMAFGLIILYALLPV